MDGIPLKRTKRNSDEFDVLRCIICQEHTGQKLSSSVKGCENILQASKVRKDHVTRRLDEIIDGQAFLYHVDNVCYKRYTLTKTLESIKSKQLLETEPEPSEIETTWPTHAKRTRINQTASRTPPSENVDMYRQKCICCGHVKKGSHYEKFRISESDRARKFLNATVYFQDDTYTRTCDLQGIHSVFGADLFCHKNCIKSYIQKYEREMQCDKQYSHTSTVPAKMETFNTMIDAIDPGLNEGQGYELSDLRDLANNINSEAISPFSNREIKVLLLNYYGDNLVVSFPREANKSAMVFLNKISIEDIADTVRSSDPIQQCAYSIREELKNSDFGLDDRFCDAADLEKSWNDIEIPEQLDTFLSIIFNIKSSGENKVQTAENIDTDDSATSKSMKKKVIYQIMYYIVHNGRSKTPLHIMNAEAIHQTCKSSILVKSFNHFGLAVSYNELLRYHKDMAAFVIERSKGNVPLPSHFKTDLFTTAAFDNFDHEEATQSGISGSHDTVAILYQSVPTESVKKQLRSQTFVKHGNKNVALNLPCQDLQEFIKPAKRATIPASYIVPKTLFEMSQSEINHVTDCDLAWSIARLDLSKVAVGEVADACEQQLMPSWSSFNSIISHDNLPVKQVGFLPVLPYPVTEYTTVYTAMKNFQNVLHQLSQRRLAVTCDEGVYHIAREIKLLHAAEFDNIVLCMGSFHMIKVLLGCLGKYLKGSGAESIWTETSAFGLHVVESVLSGSNYIRSLKGMFLLGEAMERLQWKEFFNNVGIEEYGDALLNLQEMKEKVSEKNQSGSQAAFEDFRSHSSKLKTDFLDFQVTGSKSETFLYWKTFVVMVHLLQNLLRADREGNWNLHLHTVQGILPLFAVFDRTNYLRWCTLYLEDMRQLPETAPEVYQHCLDGHFVVKRTQGHFRAIGADMCLEQTINRSQKSSGGIIGTTKRKQFVAEWELIYHEMLSVGNLHRMISGCVSNNYELQVHHEFNMADTSATEKMVSDIIQHISSRENPFHVTATTDTTLHNIITQERMPEDILSDITSVLAKGHHYYQTFRRKRFVEEGKALTDIIPRTNLKTFASLHCRTKSAKQKT